MIMSILISRKKNFARKFVEQQATKDFIKDNKPAGKETKA